MIQTLAGRKPKIGENVFIAMNSVRSTSRPQLTRNSPERIAR